MINTYFCGAGSLYLSKYDSNDKLTPFVDVGNVPTFSFSRFHSLKDSNGQDTLKIVFENFNETTFDLIFGGVAEETTTSAFSDVGKFKETYKDRKVLMTKIVAPSTIRKCAVVFEGFNIANGDRETIRFELNEVYLRPSKTFQAIGDDIAQFECFGTYTVHPDDKAFYIPDGTASKERVIVRAKPAKKNRSKKS